MEGESNEEEESSTILDLKEMLVKPCWEEYCGRRRTEEIQSNWTIRTLQKEMTGGEPRRKKEITTSTSSKKSTEEIGAKPTPEGDHGRRTKGDHKEEIWKQGDRKPKFFV
jgi:hypothetical protein